MNDTIDLTKLTEEELLNKVLDYQQLSQRLAADYQNLKKDTAERVEAVQKFALEDFIQQLCPVIDYFDSAFATIPEAERQSSWVQGIRHIQDFLLKLLRDHGVELMQPVGQPFDPNLHEAVGEEDSDQPAQIVIRQTQAGFTLNGKVIRHAKVIVTKTKMEDKNI